jgi:acyl-lipid omega-6 desaturase (Delta-12 desaturase)
VPGARRPSIARHGSGHNTGAYSLGPATFTPMTPSVSIKAEVPQLVAKYNRRSDIRAAVQVLNTCVPFLILFYLALLSLPISGMFATACIVLAAMFIVRIFMLMHDCGHRSLFRTQRLNSIFGFVTGVLCGMPQYVWSQHHSFHHATNGNWSKYTGPLGTITVQAFAQLSPGQRRRYEMLRNIMFTLPGAFMYFIVNPRINWALGSVNFMVHVAKAKLRRPRVPLGEIARGFTTPCWKDRAQYWHMFGNNVVLLSLWWVGSMHFGAAAFFTVYLASLTLGGAVGITIFTIQHNFEASYASDDAHWDYHRAALEGTSFLTLPAIANWFTADIAYHHVHHLSAGIPNYRLAACHREYAHLFGAVKRIRLRDVARSFKFILWDTDSRRIVSVAQARGPGPRRLP